MPPSLFKYLMLFLGLPLSANADTIDHYMHIHRSIPTMEMKADPEAQAWARSARNVLTITTETLAETLLEANRLAQSKSAPLFCLPPQVTLDAITMKTLIAETYSKIPGPPDKKDKMTVSQIAWLAVTERYPCRDPIKSEP